jgi:DNA polymerase-3 subunit delta
MAAELGMPPWKIRKAQGQVRGWGQEGLADAMRIVARVNAEVKGAAVSAEYALERAVLEVVAAKDER